MDENEVLFVCECVCVFDCLMVKFGGLGKVEFMYMCVMMCGMSVMDVCVDVCVWVVCMVGYGVLGWNEKCLRRCASECARGRTFTS